MTDIVARIELLIEPQATLASGQAEGMPGIVSDSAYRFGWFSAGVWRLAALHGASESFADVTLDNGAANALLRFDATKKLVPGLLRDDGVTCYHPSQFYQWTSEQSVSSQYGKATSTTVTGTAEASLLPAGAVSEVTGRWNRADAWSTTHLMGVVSSSANQVLTIRIYRNGALAATAVMPSQSYGTGTIWGLELEQIVVTPGATGAVRYRGRFRYTAANANNQTSTMPISADLTGVDLTAAGTWNITAQWGVTGNSITCETATKRG